MKMQQSKALRADYEEVQYEDAVIQFNINSEIIMQY